MKILKLIALLLLAYSNLSEASVVLSSTRKIYNEEDYSVTLQIKNQSNTPVLLQSWIDDGDLEKSPDQIVTPFIITPPLQRLEGKEKTSVKVSMLSKEELPEDRESMFWINILEVPPHKDNNNHLQMAFRTRIKLFYRPKGIEKEIGENQLEWHVVNGGIHVKNKTPFHINIIGLYSGKKVIAEGGIVKPLSEKTINGNIRSKKNMYFKYINDWGAIIESPIE